MTSLHDMRRLASVPRNRPAPRSSRALSTWKAIFLGSMFALTGCAIPESHQPRGFSSTYFHHLQQSRGSQWIGEPVSALANGLSKEPQLQASSAQEVELPDVEAADAESLEMAETNVSESPDRPAKRTTKTWFASWRRPAVK